MHWINILIILWVVLHFIVKLNKLAKEIKNSFNIAEITGFIIAFILHIFIIIYGIFFYSWIN